MTLQNLDDARFQGHLVSYEFHSNFNLPNKELRKNAKRFRMEIEGIFVVQFGDADWEMQECHNSNLMVFSGDLLWDQKEFL